MYHSIRPLDLYLQNKQQKKMLMSACFQPLPLCQFSSRVTPLWKKSEQQDDRIKWVPLEAQTVKSNGENMVEIWHFCLFRVSVCGKLQSHHSTQIWCFCLPPILMPSVERKLQWNVLMETENRSSLWPDATSVPNKTVFHTCTTVCSK